MLTKKQKKLVTILLSLALFSGCMKAEQSPWKPSAPPEKINQSETSWKTQTGTTPRLTSDIPAPTELEQVDQFIQTRDVASCQKITDPGLQEYCVKESQNYLFFDQGNCSAIIEHPELQESCLAFQEKIGVYKKQMEEYQQKIDLISQKALTQDEQGVANLNLLGNLNEFDEALSVAQKLSEANPTEVSMILNYARLLIQKGSLWFEEEKYGKQAIEVAQKALEKEQNNAEAWRIIGYANEIMENYPKALEAYEKSIASDTTNASTYSNRGHTYRLLWEMEKAQIDFEKALELNPNLDHALLNLATVYLGQTKYQEALTYYQKTIENTDNNRFKSEALYSIGSIYIEQKQYQAAEKSFQEANAIDPSFESPYLGLAKVQFLIFLEQVNTDAEIIDESLVDQALINSVSAINLNPNKALAYYQLALMYMHLGFFQETDRFFQKALELIPNDLTLSKTEKEAMQNLIHKYYNYANN